MAAVQAASIVCQSAFFGKTESQNALLDMVPKSKAVTTMKVKTREAMHIKRLLSALMIRSLQIMT